LFTPAIALDDDRERLSINQFHLIYVAGDTVLESLHESLKLALSQFKGGVRG
jgi:hypothetical protein